MTERTPAGSALSRARSRLLVRFRPLLSGPSRRAGVVRAGLAALMSAPLLVPAYFLIDARLTGAAPGPAVEPATQSASQDTVFLFGPKRFDAASNGTSVYVERFIVATSLPSYTLRVENGAADGTGRVDSASVVLNGVEVLTPEDFLTGDRILTRSVQLASQDTVVVSIARGAGDFLTLSFYTTPDPTVTLYGPLRVEIGTGNNTTVTDTFSLPAGVAPPYRVHVVNGAPDGTKRAKSGSVTLNGVNVLTPTEINEGVASVVKEVQILPNNTFTVQLTQSKSGSHVTVRFSASDTTPPVLTIASPSEGFITNRLKVLVSGSISDRTLTKVSVNGQIVPVTNNSSFSDSVPLATEGSNTLQITAIDGAGNRTDSIRSVIRDTHSPTIILTEPVDSLVVNKYSGSPAIRVVGSVQDETAVTLRAEAYDDLGTFLECFIPVYQKVLEISADGSFSDTIPESAVWGDPCVGVRATDAANNFSVVVRDVFVDRQPPKVVVKEPVDGATTSSDSILVRLWVQEAFRFTDSVTANNIPLAFVPNVEDTTNWRGTIPLAVGLNTIRIVAVDWLGNDTLLVRTVTREGTLPPDPATVASPIDPTVGTTLATSTEFLYTGTNPIQTGVAAGTIEPTRVGVVRGRVLTAGGQPLAGVTVTILGHPEFGSTLSRADGAFDMAVNGGGPLVVAFENGGFLPAQRPANVPWQDYVVLDDVVMIPLDAQATVIDFSEPVEVARGNVVTDEDGTRQGTVLFEQGTQATLVNPDGTTQPLTSLTVRATEYTVGAAGPKAMPAPLPPTSAYTYAVELSADEAISAGAKEVRFSQPVPFYVENFLGLPVGTIVPAASYDREKAAWIPSRNGRVIQIVGINGGLAELDTNGDGVADGPTTLAQLGISDVERQELATLYATGQSLWRVEVEHFSTIDLNLPEGLPDDARTANVEGAGQNDPTVDDECNQTRSIIGCQNQSLGEVFPVSGTPLSLHYDSKRMPGRRDAYALDIPLSRSAVPASLKRIDLEVQIAGRLFRDTFPALPNQTHTFIWDGKDAYGRVLQGRQPLTTRIGYVYDFFYIRPDTIDPAFGLPSGSAIVLRSARRDETLWQTNRSDLGNVSAILVSSLGGWSLDAHHLYDVTGHVLHRGDGTRRSADAMFPVIKIVAGKKSPFGSNGEFGDFGDGGPATEAAIGGAGAVAVAPDGSVFVTAGNRVRRIGPSGIINAFAGTGAFGFSGDGGAATAATFNGAGKLALGPDGSVYVVDEFNLRIRRIGLDGVITTVAGNGTQGFGGDGGPATDAALNFPVDVAVGLDGSLYIADAENNRIRRVDAGGIITTFAGNGTCDAYAEGLPALQTAICVPLAVAVGPEGELYVAMGRRILRIGSDGIVRTAAGTGGFNSSGDGGPAREAPIDDPNDVAVGPDGAIYIADGDCCTTGPTVRKVTSDGIIARVAGGGLTFDGDGGPATQLFLGSPGAVAIGPDGGLYIPAQNFVRKVAPAFPGLSTGDFTLASEDGSELYILSPAGRHLRTLDPLTGTLRLEFSYDSVGRLTQVIDGDSLVTTIERDTAGTPLAIMGPFGQRTTFSVDSLARLATIANPAGETVRLGYTPDGLLTTLTDPRSNLHTFAYDSLGRLVRDSDAVGGFVSLARTELATGFEVRTTTTLGRATAYRVERLPTGDERRVNTDPAGRVTTSTRKTDGTVTTASPDGTVTSLAEGPDPRFGMASSILKSLTVTTPGGLSSTVTASRRATLADPSNPLSLLSLIDTVVVNGRVYTSTYDQALKRFTNQTPEGRTSVVRIDSLGRPLEEQLGNLQPVQYAYDAQGRLSRVTQGARVMSFTYDVQGRLLTMTDPVARVDSFFYDAADRLVRQVLPDGNEVGFSYDSAGNVVSVTPPSRPAHAFAYNAVDLDTVYSPPDLTGGPTPTRYAYNLDRQLTQVLRPDGGAITFAYDSVSGRLQDLTTARGSFGYSYDTTTGRLSKITTPEADTVAFTYDGSLVTRERWAGRVAGSVAFGFDSDFRASSLVVNGADTTRFLYDADGLLTTAGRLALTRDAGTGFLTGTSLDSVVTRRGYNAIGELVADTAFLGAAALYATTLARDSLGRVREHVETVDGVTTTYAYGYDDVGRLVEVTKDGVVVESYEYDANGNRARFTGPAGSVSGTYDAQDRLLTYGSSSYTYTAASELETKVVGADTTRYRYDALGNLLSVELPGETLVEYLVDGLNRRVGKMVNGVLIQSFLYQDQLKPVAELDGSGQVVARFVYGSKANVPDYMVKGGVTYRVVSDHLGSVRLVVDAATGQVVQRLDYDSFGKVTVNTNPGFQPFGFAGGLHDEGTGLIRFGVRDYDSTVGRWTVKDPLGFAGGDSNLYGYALNDPINLIDPDGLRAARGCPGESLAECVAERAVENFRTTHEAIRQDLLLRLWRWGSGVTLGAQYVSPEGAPGVLRFIIRTVLNPVSQKPKFVIPTGLRAGTLLTGRAAVKAVAKRAVTAAVVVYGGFELGVALGSAGVGIYECLR